MFQSMLKELRLREGISQYKLAKLLGVASPPWVCGKAEKTGPPMKPF